MLNVRNNSHPILIENNFNDCFGIDSYDFKNKKVLIVSQENIATLYFKDLENIIVALGGQCFLFLIENGESGKDYSVFDSLIEFAILSNLNKQDVLVALGGGVVGDIAGFCASSLYRGVDFLQIPTTLLSQIDSAIGGKNAVNYNGYKNIIGSIYQPKYVFIYLSLLDTLPDKMYFSAFSEIVKYALILEPSFLSYIETHLDSIISKNKMVLYNIVYKSCSIKVSIVQQDEYDKGIRNYLNLGHTFGHAMETFSYLNNDEPILHGEAVAIGIILSLRLSVLRGYISSELLTRIKLLFLRLGLPINIPKNMSYVHFMNYMKKDKKKTKQINFVVLTDLGVATLLTDVSAFELQQILLT